MRFRKEAFVLGSGVLAALLVAFSLNHFFGKKQRDEFHYRYATEKTKDPIGQQIRIFEKRGGGAMDQAILADLYFDQGRRTGDTAYYDKAEQIARLSLKALPSPNLGAKGVLAKVAAARHQFVESIRIGHEMLTENAGSDGALAVLATAYLATGDLPKAMEFADRLALAKPLMSNLALRGLVLLAQGREAEGVFEFRHALALEEYGQANQSAWTRAILGRYFLQRGQYEPAKQLLEEAARITPEFPLALDLLGQVELKQKHFAKAESYFNEAFAVSRQIPYLLHLAQATELKGQKGSADALRSQAEDLIRKELVAGAYGHRLDLVRVLLERNAAGVAAEAVTLAQEETKVRQNAETYYVLSLALARANRFAESRVAIASALRVGGREPEYYYQAAQTELQVGSGDRAALYLEQVQRQNPIFTPPAVVAAPKVQAQAR